MKYLFNCWNILHVYAVDLCIKWEVYRVTSEDFNPFCVCLQYDWCELVL